MKTRIHSHIAVIVGGRGTGKTTFVKELIKKSPKPKKIITDTFHHPSYADTRAISGIELIRLKSGEVHYHNSDTELMLADLTKVANALIVLEDCSKYVAENPQPTVKNLCLDSKQKNTDLIFIYHSLAEVPKKLYRWIDYLEIFKTQEVFENQKNRISAYERIYPTYVKVREHKSQYHHQTVQLL